MKKITIVSPCYNEENNIENLYYRVKDVIDKQHKYIFEYIFIDNASEDNTVAILKSIADADNRVKIIVNVKNFGHIRSPYWGILQSTGDATIYIASDLQDPPELIEKFLMEWERGHKIVLGVKVASQESRLFYYIRKKYYQFLDCISEVKIIKNSTGFGLYDRKIVEILKQINDPYPFLRGLIGEIGYDIKEIDFEQPKRAFGKSKNNFYSLYDIGILGLISQSIIPIRIATFFGFIFGTISLMASVIVFILKLIFWDKFVFGMAPAVIAILILFGMVLIFLGILGEYIVLISRYVRNRPIIIERERYNF